MNKNTQPIRSRKKINELLTYLKGKSYRDYMIAKIQLNTARRISDIVKLKVSDFLDPSYEMKRYVTIQEQKTKKVAKIVINQSLQEAIKDYVTCKELAYDDYLFHRKPKTNYKLSVNF